MDCITLSQVTEALNRITGGRLPGADIPRETGRHPYIMEKSSGLAGKSVLETPGLVVGDPKMPVHSIGIGMTLTESMIELAGGMNLSAILVHHPVADAASSGGVPMKAYLELYGLSLLELHEAFHGLHPGIALLHGHRVIKTHTAFCGIPGNIVLAGEALPEIRQARDIVDRLNRFMDLDGEGRVLAAEANLRCCPDLRETSLTVVPRIIVGREDAAVRHVLHFFPHTGFNTAHLEAALEAHPDTDTLVVSISRVRDTGEMAEAAEKSGLTLIAGNSHAHEIYENGLPLAWALHHELPGLEIVMLRERMTATRLSQFGSEKIQTYGRDMARHMICK